VPSDEAKITFFCSPVMGRLSTAAVAMFCLQKLNNQTPGKAPDANYQACR
jgi:hypothetical protein